MQHRTNSNQHTFRRAIVEHGVLFAGLVAVMAPIALLAPGLPALVIGTILWLGACAASTVRLPTVGGWGMLCLTLPMGGMGMLFADVVTLETGDVRRGLPVADAPALPDAIGFEFSDAVVRADLAATHRTSSRSSSGGSASSTYVIAPLTGPEWRPGDPVPAWVGCRIASGTACPGWSQGRRAAMRAPHMLEGNFGQARTIAMTRHGLREHPGAPLLELVASVDGARRERRRLWLGMVGGGYLFWLFFATIGAAVDGLDRAWGRWRR